MGLLNAMFGGGTKLELALDATRIPEGGLLSGTVTLGGGKKPLEMKELRLQLHYVKSETREGETMPSITFETLVDHVLADSQPLAPGSVHKFPFTIPVPTGTDPKGKYRASAHADIPGVADPSDAKDLTVSPAQQRNLLGFAKGAAATSAEDILARFPDLRSADEWSLVSALNDLACESFDRDQNFVAIEPYLARLMTSGKEHVRVAALRTWGSVMNDRATPAQIKTLEAIAYDPAVPRDVLETTVEVAAKFAEEGALPLLIRFTQHPDPDLRRVVAEQLQWNVDASVKERRGLLEALCRDADAGVRATAIRGLTGFASEPGVVQGCFAALRSDPSPDVHRACIPVIAIGQHYGLRDDALNCFVWLLGHPSAEVRSELASQIAWFPPDPRVGEIVTRLLADADSTVRASMAWQSVNMTDHPELATHFMAVATNDPSREIRANALQGLGAMMPPGDAVAAYRQALASDPNEAIGLSVVRGLERVKAHAAAAAMLRELASSPLAEVARSARDAMRS